MHYEIPLTADINLTKTIAKAEKLAARAAKSRRTLRRLTPEGGTAPSTLNTTTRRGGPVPGPRLELTWPNKDKFLLTPKDDAGKPVWVERSHPAAHEVRLTRPTAAVGDTNTADPYLDNTVMVGDSLDAMKVLCEVPEWAAHYRGKVKLIYADPPFNTGQTFTHYDDWMEHSVWLSFARERLLLMKDLLAPDGSVWIHLDDAEVHRMRCLLDEVFGAENFIGTVIWNHTAQSKNDQPHFSNHHNQLLVYGRARGTRRFLLPRGPEHNKAYSNPDQDPRGDWRSGDVRSPNPRPTLTYEIETPGGKTISPPAKGWRWSRETLAAKIATGEVVFADDETRIVRKIYLADQPGRTPENLWLVGEVGGTRDANREMKSVLPETAPFSTPKPERLLERVLAITTDPGDIVLDPFAGSGTTAAVAQKMGRRWLTVELSASTAATFVVPRLTKVVEGTDPGGITEKTGWAGGGGFRVVAVEPSLYEVGPGGLVLLGEDINADDLARAMCGQLRFTYTPDNKPFAGQRGRMLLAVVPGVASVEQVDDLLAALPEGTRLTLAAGAFVPGVADHLASSSRGSRALKIPRDVLTRSLRRTADRQETSR